MTGRRNPSEHSFRSTTNFGFRPYPGRKMKYIPSKEPSLYEMALIVVFLLCLFSTIFMIAWRLSKDRGPEMALVPVMQLKESATSSPVPSVGLTQPTGNLSMDREQSATDDLDWDTVSIAFPIGRRSSNLSSIPQD